MPDGEREVALKAMRDRGIDFPEHFLQYAEPERILGACYAWDRKGNASPALLAWQIKQGGMELRRPTDSAGREQPVYDVASLPTLFMRHAEWDTRRGYFPSCREGRLMVVEARWPISTIECDSCGWLAGLPHRSLTQGLRITLGLEQQAA